MIHWTEWQSRSCAEQAPSVSVLPLCVFAFQNPPVDFKAKFERADKEAEGVIRDAQQVIVSEPAGTCQGSPH